MGNLTRTSELVAQHPKGSIMAVKYSGVYPLGSDGNQCAREMVAYLDSVLDDGAAAILFDLRTLEYSWGDAIGSLAVTLARRGPSRRPSAIAATGHTSDALAPLLGAQSAFGVMGTKMFGSMVEAISHLTSALDEQTD